MHYQSLNRRTLLKGLGASFALSAMNASAMNLLSVKKYRVGLIGSGWYGKNDLFRLMQVADVEVVALCDVARGSSGNGDRENESCFEA
jgi:predicted homoserine dehydrogenase-like protein